MYDLEAGPTAGWVAALDRLEADLADTERSLASGDAPRLAPWQPPTLAGPPPAPLVERATALLARQQEVLDLLVTRMGGNRRQQELAARAVSGRGTERPVYVDVNA